MRKTTRGAAPLSQNMIGGLCLIATGVLGVWLTGDLSQGSLSAMGAGFLPRGLAVGVGALGIILTALSIRSPGEALGQIRWRAIGLVALAIIGFAMMIRPFPIYEMNSPGLGLIVAGPFAIIVSGYATPEARLGELVILSLTLTALCMLLFADLLNLPIPIFPQFLVPYLAGVPAKLLLRSAAALMIVVSAAVVVLKRIQDRKTMPISSSLEVGHD